ncbi:MAG: hypothetical protein IAE83_06035 [Anaerolinea sp.]|nr:hypothetical protein [Anaerolinea sp.]
MSDKPSEPPKRSTLSLPKPPAWMTSDEESTPSAIPEMPKPLQPMQPMIGPVEAPAPTPTPLRPPSSFRPTNPELPAAVEPAQTPPHAEITRRSTPVELGPTPVPVIEPVPMEDVEGDEDAAETLFDLEPDEPLLNLDPTLAYIVLIVIMIIGTSSFAPDVRYTLLWVGAAVVGVGAITADDLPVERPSLRDLLIGAAYGLLVGLPLLIVGGAQLKRLSQEMFAGVGDTALFQSVVFVMPLAETLFFRGALQSSRGPIVTSLAAAFWSLLLFLPALGFLQFPLVGLVVGISFLFLSFLYSYLRERIGLFTAWTCQIAVNLLLLWAARLIA